MIKELKQLQEIGAGSHSVITLIEYYKMLQKYNAVKMQGFSHIETCEHIGISDRHMYRIIHLFKKMPKICQ